MPVNDHTIEHHVNRVREFYARGRLSDSMLEPAIEHVLRGGYVSDDLKLRSPLLDLVRCRRRCASEGHALIDISGFGDLDGRHRCARCDYRET